MSDPIRFYFDEHIASAVAQGLRVRGVDVLTVVETQMLSASDLELLEYATTNSRVMVSQDADFLRLHAAGHEHCGLVYAPQQTSVGAMIAGLMLIYEVLTPADMVNHIEFL